MKASTKTVFESDPDRLPPITFVVGPHIALAVAEAIDALVRGDLDACLASANTPGLDGQDRLLALIASGLAHYRKGDFAECERIAAVMKALAPNVSFVELFSAVSLEYRGRVDLASTGFVAALSLGRSHGQRFLREGNRGDWRQQLCTAQGSDRGHGGIWHGQNREPGQSSVTW